MKAPCPRCKSAVIGPWVRLTGHVDLKYEATCPCGYVSECHTPSRESEERHFAFLRRLGWEPVPIGKRLTVVRGA